jgi:hypothetical protein
LCTADLGFTGGKNDIGAATDTDFIGACTPALRFLMNCAVGKSVIKAKRNCLFFQSTDN